MCVRVDVFLSYRSAVTRNTHGNNDRMDNDKKETNMEAKEVGE